MQNTVKSLNCVVHHFFSKNIAQVFIKLTQSFVAIELLTFCKHAKQSILLLKRALGISYVNRIDFFLLFVYKNVSKNCFFYINENYDNCHHRKTTRTFIYTRRRKNSQAFLYTKSQTHFKKLGNFRYVFQYKEQYT